MYYLQVRHGWEVRNTRARQQRHLAADRRPPEAASAEAEGGQHSLVSPAVHAVFGHGHGEEDQGTVCWGYFPVWVLTRQRYRESQYPNTFLFGIWEMGAFLINYKLHLPKRKGANTRSFLPQYMHAILGPGNGEEDQGTVRWGYFPVWVLSYGFFLN